MKAREEIALDPASTLARALDRIERAGPTLRAMERSRIARAIGAAVRMIGEDETPLGRQLAATVPARAGLSPEGVRWALATTLAELDEAAVVGAIAELEALEARVSTTPVRGLGLVLAGNVLTAGLRPIVWSLLCRVPALVKVATTDAGLSELFALALTLADEEIGAAVGIVHFSRDDEGALSRMASALDVLSVHGSDRTIETARRIAPGTTEVVPHGHGLGIALVPKAALGGDVDLRPLLDALALDVAAYDQRGCLSPHAILVEKGGAISARELARRLSEESLASLARSMPRGTLSVLEGSVQVRWRGVAQSIGELFEGDGWSVAHEEGALRSCPLHRNVAVHEVASEDEALARLAPFGVHLKALGVAGTARDRERLARKLPAGLAPRLSALGAMQRPPLLAPTDGVPPWHALVRFGARG